MNLRILTTVIILLLTLAGTALVSTATTSIPPDGTDHGINESTFVTFWSEDEDTDGSIESLPTSDDTDQLREMMRVTDWVFDTAPEQEVQQWNAGDQYDFQHGGVDSAVYPLNTDRTDTRFVKDAYIRTFSISPSTQVHDETGATTQYITTDGTVRAISDYRVALPEDDTRVQWELQTHEVTNTALYIDEELVDRASGSHTPVLEYTNIDSASTLTIEATIQTEVDKTTRERRTSCSGTGENRTCSSYWHIQTETLTNDISVTDTTDVTVEELSASEQTVHQQRDGDESTGYAIETTGPWSQITLPDETIIRSNWRFYTASSTDWHTLQTTDGHTTTESVSSVRPVRIYAFPSDFSIRTTNPDAHIAANNGVEKPAPQLPENITVSVVDEEYTDVTNIAVETDGLPPEDTTTVDGLVTGTDTTPDTTRQTARETNLTVMDVERTPANVTITTRVEDAETGEPITTGTMTIADTETSLSADGETTVSVDRQPVSVGITYNPVPWWESDTDTIYTGSSTSVSMASGSLPDFDDLANLAVATLFWFVPIAVTIYALNLISDGTIYHRGDR